MSTKTLTPDQSPALHERSDWYPRDRFGDRVPLRIRMLENVRSEVPFLMAPYGVAGTVRVALAGREYPAWVNSHGAVVALLEDGQLGVKPAEFEVTAWHPQEDIR